MLKQYVTWLAARTTPALIIGDTVHAGPIPDDAPDLCTAVIEGPSPQHPDLSRESQVRIQFLTRGLTHMSARDEAWRVFNAAAHSTGYPLGDGWQLHSTPQMNGPMWIGHGPRGHYEFSANLTLQVRKPN